MLSAFLQNHPVFRKYLNHGSSIHHLNRRVWLHLLRIDQTRKILNWTLRVKPLLNYQNLKK